MTSQKSKVESPSSAQATAGKQKHNSNVTKTILSTVVIDTLEYNKEFVVKDNERKTFVILLCGQTSSDGAVHVRIVGEGANVQILGIILGREKQSIRLYTEQLHEKPSSVSDLFIKSVLFDQSKLFYTGLIKIASGAQQSNAYQKNQNLLLSSGAWADSRPMLEILANDVRCTHGATIGTLDEEQLYYLAARGIGRNAASRLIVEGFVSEVLQRIPDEDIQEDCRKKVMKELAGLFPEAE